VKIHLNITVRGHVQRVGFRYHARKTASSLDINGFVSNQSDGSVYIEAEGEEKALEVLIHWCHQGPAMARVEEVERISGNLKGFQTFEII
jgi:acylphosphatase